MLMHTVLFSLAILAARAQTPQQDSLQFDQMTAKVLMQCAGKNHMSLVDVQKIFEFEEFPKETEALNFLGCMIMEIFIKDKILDCGAFFKMTDHNENDCNEHKELIVDCLNLETVGEENYSQIAQNFNICGQKFFNQPDLFKE